MSIIIDKLKNLGRDMRNLKENVHVIKGRYESCNGIYYGDNCLSNEELKCMKATESKEDDLLVTVGNNSPSGNRPNLEETFGRYLEESCKRQYIFDEWMKIFRENTNKNLRRHDFAIKVLEEKVVQLVQAVFTYNELNQDKTVDMKSSTIISPISVDSNLVLIILRRPMLATAHAMIDVFGRKTSPEVGKEKVIFNANVGMTPLSVLSICVINDFQDNDLFPAIDMDSFEAFSDSDNGMGIGLDDFGEGTKYLWDAQDPVITPNKGIDPPL
ncbi:hypothetical protein Tco_1104876 [Tanacetum coccineum]